MYKKPFTKQPINKDNQSLLSYNIYKNQIHCETEKHKHIRGAFRNSAKHPKEVLL